MFYGKINAGRHYLAGQRQVREMQIAEITGGKKSSNHSTFIQMRFLWKKWKYLGLLPIVFLVSSSFEHPAPEKKPGRFPYRKAGLTARQAAAHLLSRFTYGARPGEVDRVVDMGLENWFKTQLAAQQPDSSLDALLSDYDALVLSNREITEIFPKPGQALRMAIRDGAIHENSVQTGSMDYRNELQSYMKEKGLRPLRDLERQFVSQKVLRATYTDNQLLEVMTSFWFNHFNVSLTKNDCAQFIPSYERDVIRPNSLGKFGALLLATAQSPAMLFYLDNFSSSGNPAGKLSNIRRQAGKPVPPVQPAPQGKQGLNENYAREVMELHTLGVDGGYTQADVTEAARVLTGWTVVPMGNYRTREQNEKMRDEAARKSGFVVNGDFLFARNRHDAGEKKVLGRHFAAGGGYEEGVELLKLLADHPSTARFISQKLAIRFVSDTPPERLIDKMAASFRESGGDIRQVLTVMVHAPEFWSAGSVREKTKSPFELAIGAVRSLNGEITQPFQLFNWIGRMGERIYSYQAPTGFPDKGQYWINTGSLLNRMNFGLALASGRIPGVKVDLEALNRHREPESMQAALATYGKLLMPERDLEATIRRLEPMLNDPGLFEKVNNASRKVNRRGNDPAMGDRREDGMMVRASPVESGMKADRDPALLSRVVGVILGSPEYQRR